MESIFALLMMMICQNIWINVKKEQTQMLTANYDTCSRFDNNATSCNQAKGLANSSCKYLPEIKKCRAEYTPQATTKFGKKKLKKGKVKIKIKIKKSVKG